MSIGPLREEVYFLYSNIRRWEEQLKWTKQPIAENRSDRPSLMKLLKKLSRTWKLSVWKCGWELIVPEKMVLQGFETMAQVYRLKACILWGTGDNLKRYDFPVEILDKIEVDEHFLTELRLVCHFPYVRTLQCSNLGKGSPSLFMNVTIFGLLFFGIASLAPFSLLKAL